MCRRYPIREQPNHYRHGWTRSSGCWTAEDSPARSLLDALLHYPALLALRTMSIVTIDEGRDDFLIELLTHPRWTDPYVDELDRLWASSW